MYYPPLSDTKSVFHLISIDLISKNAVTVSFTAEPIEEDSYTFFKKKKKKKKKKPVVLQTNEAFFCKSF